MRDSLYSRGRWTCGFRRVAVATTCLCSTYVLLGAAQAADPSISTRVSGSFWSTLHPSEPATSASLRMVAVTGEILDPTSILPPNASDFVLLPGEMAEVAVHIVPDAAEIDRGPVEVLILLDTSTSMGLKRDDVRDALVGAAGLLRRQDTISVLGFSSSPRVIGGPTNDPATLHTLLENVRFVGNTDFAEAVATGPGLLPPSPGATRIGFLITDGQPTSEPPPLQQFEQINRTLRDNPIGFPINTIGLGDGVDEVLLQMIAEGTGGAAGALDGDTLAVLLQSAIREAIGEPSTWRVGDAIGDAFNVVQRLSFHLDGQETLAEGVQRDLRLAGISFREHRTLATPPIGLSPASIGTLDYQFAAETARPSDCLIDTRNRNRPLTAPLDARVRAVDLAAGVTRSRGGSDRTTPLDDPHVTILPCGVYTRAAWDEAGRTITLAVWNATSAPLMQVSVGVTLTEGFTVDSQRPFAAGKEPTETRDAIQGGHGPSLTWERVALGPGDHIEVSIPVSGGAPGQRALIVTDGSGLVFEAPTLLFEFGKQDPNAAFIAGLLDREFFLSDIGWRVVVGALADAVGVNADAVIAERQPQLEIVRDIGDPTDFGFTRQVRVESGEGTLMQPFGTDAFQTAQGVIFRDTLLVRPTTTGIEFWGVQLRVGDVRFGDLSTSPSYRP